MIRVSWISTGSTYRKVEGDIKNLEKVEPGIYEVGLDMSGWFLQKTADSFVFNFKIYDLQNNFLEHVLNTYNNTKGNLGILFNGTRGTGKSISAKILANSLNLPVIIVKSFGDKNQDLIQYLSSFNFDCIYFFDEFEKQFSSQDCSILQIMDGIYTSEYRRIFLLTTNELTVNENLISRPSRIRYIREFRNLDKHVVLEYLNDNLQDKSAIDDLMEYIQTLKISTIDILKSIVEEVNIHGIKKFLEIKNFFNVQSSVYEYRVVYKRLDKQDCKDIDFAEFCRNFQKTATLFQDRFTIREALNSKLKAVNSKKEKEEIERKLNELRNTVDRCSFGIFRYDKPWYRYNVGECFDDCRNDYDDEGNQIVYIDKKNAIMILKTDSAVYAYLIQNPNEKPSLYSNTSTQFQSVKDLAAYMY